MSILSDIKSSLNNGHTKIKEDFDKFINEKNDTGSVLLTKTVYRIRLGVSDNKYLEKKIKEIFKDVDTIMNEFYNRIMKSFDNSILELKKAEKETEDMVLPTVIKTRYKAISSAIHIANYIKYKSSQLVASACLKMYKKSFSEAMKMNDRNSFYTSFTTDKDGNPVEPIDPEKEKERIKKYNEKYRIEDERRELELIEKHKAIKDKLNKTKIGEKMLDGLYNDPDKRFEKFKDKIKDRIKIDKNDTIESIKRKMDKAGKDDILEI